MLKIKAGAGEQQQQRRREAYLGKVRRKQEEGRWEGRSEMVWHPEPSFRLVCLESRVVSCLVFVVLIVFGWVSRLTDCDCNGVDLTRRVFRAEEGVGGGEEEGGGRGCTIGSG